MTRQQLGAHKETGMTSSRPRIPKIGFFFWPTSVAQIQSMGELAEAYGFDLVGVADSPGQAMDCWVAATLLSQAAPNVPTSVCVTNFVSRHWTTTASAAASVAMTHDPGFVLGLGSGHSAVRNFGMSGSRLSEMESDLGSIMDLVKGDAVPNGEGAAQLTCLGAPPRTFLAGSHRGSIRLAGAEADGVFINYGLRAENLEESTALVAEGARSQDRDPKEVETWQVAVLDCTDDGGETARAAIGKICAFATGYLVGKRDPVSRGVPPELSDAVRELVSRYSTRPSQADSDLVRELGLFDYLSQRLAVCGSPDDCLAQIRAAADAGAERLMFSVGKASDPIRTIELIGKYVLPELRSTVAHA